MKKIKYSILIIVGLLYMCSYKVITHMGAKDGSPVKVCGLGIDLH